MTLMQHAELAKLLDLQAKDMVLIAADAKLKAILDRLAALDSDARSREGRSPGGETASG